MSRKRRWAFLYVSSLWRWSQASFAAPEFPSRLPPVGIPRGGETPLEDEELDAYIENLISSVDISEAEKSDAYVGGEGENDQSSVEEVRDDEGDVLEPNDEAEEDEDQEVLDEEQDPTITGAENLEVDSVAEESVDEDADNASAEIEAEEDASTLAKGGSTKGSENDNNVAKSNDDEKSKNDKDVSRDTRLPRPRPPNAVYRFLLHQGRFGHVLVMTSVLLIEWVNMYLPPLARFLAWLFSRFFPERPVVERRRPRPPSAKLSSSSARTGRSSKQRKAFTRQADEAALQQLKRVGNIRQAKYRHVSIDFMKRHGLGPFANDATTRDMIISKETVVMGEKVDEDEDEEWVVQALTKPKARRSKRSPVQPTFSVEVGTGGPSVSVGFEVGIGGSRKAPTNVSTRKRRSGPRASDRDGGDGIIGRIRVGANSRISRSLMGAYPGDAVPLEEAASSEGVASLASRYGYGDWSDDEEEDAFTDRRSSRRRRRKRHPKRDGSSSGRRHEHSFSDTMDSDFEVGGLSGGHSFSSFRKTSLSTTRRKNPEPPLTSSPTLGSSSRPLERQKSAATMIRPATELLDEVRRRGRTRKEDGDD